MKTRYFVKAYSFSTITNAERYHYFGKGEHLVGYIILERGPYGTLNWDKNDVKKYGFASFKAAQEALVKMKRAEKPERGWTTVFTLIAEGF